MGGPSDFQAAYKDLDQFVCIRRIDFSYANPNDTVKLGMRHTKAQADIDVLSRPILVTEETLLFCGDSKYLSLVLLDIVSWTLISTSYCETFHGLFFSSIRNIWAASWQNQ